MREAAADDASCEKGIRNGVAALIMITRAGGMALAGDADVIRSKHNTAVRGPVRFM